MVFLFFFFCRILGRNVYRRLCSKVLFGLRENLKFVIFSLSDRDRRVIMMCLFSFVLIMSAISITFVPVQVGFGLSCARI